MRRRRRSRCGLALVLAASLSLDLTGVTWGLPAIASWSNDDIAPLGPLKAARDRFAGFTKYPPVHYALLALVDAPYLGWLRLTGRFGQPSPEYPHGFAEPVAALGVCILLGRLVSVLMGAGTVYFVFRTAAQLAPDRRAALFAAAAAAFNAHVVLFSHLSNVDGPLLFWLALSLALALRLARRWRPRDAVRLGAAGALAAGTKDPAAGFLAGLALALLWIGIRRRDRGVLAWGAASFVLLYALVNNLLLGWSAFAARLAYWLGGPGTSRYIAYDLAPADQLALLAGFLDHLKDGAGWPMLLAAAGGLMTAARGVPRDRLALLLAGPLLYYLACVALVRFAYERFTLPWVLLLAPCAGLCLARLTRGGAPARGGGPARSGSTGRGARLAAAGVLALSALWAARVPARMLLDARYDAEEFLRARLPPGSRVETYGPETYLPRLREMAYEVTRIDPTENGTEGADAALSERGPDAVVLSSNDIVRHAATAEGYLEALRAGRLGYRPHVFRGAPAWLGRPDRSEFVRVNPTIWVLLPEQDGPPAAR